MSAEAGHVSYTVRCATHALNAGEVWRHPWSPMHDGPEAMAAFMDAGSRCPGPSEDRRGGDWGVDGHRDCVAPLSVIRVVSVDDDHWRCEPAPER